MSHERLLFTSESVTSGHPDKLCDAISDAILDACLAQDPGARVACETLVKGMDADSHIVLAGEISIAGSEPDYEAIARSTAASIGYTSQDVGMDANSCSVDMLISTQSQDISRGVGAGSEQKAGDQGMMFGYATSESEVYPTLKGKFMPLSALLSQALTRRLTEAREQGILPWARPDGKSQVSIEYGGYNKPRRVWAIVIAIQHDDLSAELGGEGAEHALIVEQVRELVIDVVIPSDLFDSNTDIIVNGSGRVV